MALLTGAVACRDASRAALPSVLPNDNTAAGGALHTDTLRLTLVARRAVWRPEADSGPSVEVVAFAEDGKAPQIPAPMIRVREGTVVDVTVRNTLADSTMNVIGLRSRPDPTHDTLRVRPGESQRVTFMAGAPGTYLYAAVLGHHHPEVDEERETLAGAFIIDPRDGSPPDRVLVLNIWGTLKDSVTYANALAINGRSWPFTEHLAATVGDTLRWRVINATIRPHPMHLHGFYFTVASRGDPYVDTSYTPDQRPTMVTERMPPGGSMLLTTVPDRPGNWLFHCHIAYHVVPEAAQLHAPDSTHDETHSASADEHMRGLILGINVASRRGDRAERRTGTRVMQLNVLEREPRADKRRRMEYTLDDASAGAAWHAGGPMLVLQQGQPTDITVVNHLQESTSVHWHGIELRSEERR